MFMICAICNQSLKQCPAPTSSGWFSEKVLATRCGHVFHHTCINNWWKSMQKQSKLYGCPNCEGKTSQPFCFQLYFSTADEDEVMNEVSEQEEEIRMLKKIVADNEQKLKVMEEKVAHLKTKLTALSSATTSSK